MTSKGSARHTAHQAAQVKPGAAQAAARVKPVAAQAAARVKPVAAQAAARVKPVAAQTAARVKPVAAQTAARVKPVAAQTAARVKPVARSAGAVTRRGVYRTRAWAAPQVKRSGEALEATVAPKLSAMLLAAAQRIEPEKPRERHLRKIVGLSLVAAAASAAAAALRRRAKPDLGAPTSATDPDNTATATEMPASHPATSTEAEVNSQVRTP